MDLSKLTLQELRESRDDLIKAILTEADEGKQIVSLETQIKTLQEAVDSYKAADAKRALQEAIAGELKAAGLDPANKTQCSEIFLEDLHATADVAKRQGQDRRPQGTSSPPPGRPRRPPRSPRRPCRRTPPGRPSRPSTAPLAERLRRFAK